MYSTASTNSPRISPWQEKPLVQEAVTPALVQAAGGSPILAKLLATRGFTTPEAVSVFLHPLNHQPASPSLLPDIELAMSRIQLAIQQQEMILVWGDFDVDGVTGTSVFMEALQTLGAKVSYYIPSRHDEGHGLNSAALMRLVSSRQIKVVITTDCGTGNFKEISLLKSLGVDVIVTDHHELPDNLPPAHAIVNALRLDNTHPFRYLSGAGIAFHVARALYQAAGLPESESDKLLDIAAIGTIVDLVPLVSENRYWVTRGLQVIASRQRVGLKKLLETAQFSIDSPVTSTTVGFTIGPRINALGRLMRADDAVTLLTTQDEELATEIALKLEQCNKTRQTLVEQTYQEAIHHVQNTGSLDGEKVVIVAAPHWNSGIVGLVATRLVELTNRPAFVGVIDEAKQQVKFSGRSLPGVHLMEILSELQEEFLHSGGHAAAGGFAIPIEKYASVKQKLYATFRKQVSDEALVAQQDVDMKLNLEQLSLNLYELISQMAPFGMGNPEPVFSLENIKITSPRYLGEAKKHLKVLIPISSQIAPVEAVYWSWPYEQLPDPSQPYHALFTLSENTYQGNSKLQLMMKALLPANLVNSQSTLQQLRTQPQETKLDAEKKFASPQPAITHNLPFQLHDDRQHPVPQLDSYLLDWAQSSDHVFTMGTQHFMPIPFAEDKLITLNNSSQAAQCGKLLLWDFPSDSEQFWKLISQLNPKQVYLMGGKYQLGPSVDSALVYLKGMRNYLQKRFRENEFKLLTLPLSELSSRFALNNQATLAGLSLFSGAGIFQVVLSEGSHTQDNANAICSIQIPGNPNTEPVDNLIHRVEFRTFEALFNDVKQYRRWWMESSLDALGSQLALEYERFASR